LIDIKQGNDNVNQSRVKPVKCIARVSLVDEADITIRPLLLGPLTSLDDIVNKFIDEFVKRDNGSTVYLDEVYRKLREYYYYQIFDHTLMQKRSLKEYLDMNLYDSCTSSTYCVYWDGYTLNPKSCI